MRELLETLDAWQAEGVQVGRAVVIRTYGSAPRREGSVLLYSSDGRIAGSVSGGCVEGAAAEEIDRARATGLARVVRYGISDEQAWGVGLACGGTIDVLIQPRVPREAVDAARNPESVAVLTALPPSDGAASEPPLVIEKGGALTGTTNDPDTNAALSAAADEALLRGTSRVVDIGDRQFFIEAFAVKSRLVIIGAVEIARPLVKLAHELDLHTVVIDARETFATRERFPEADELIIGWPDEVAAQIGLNADDSVAVLSHDVKLDEPAIIAALQHGCRYVGAIGSKKTQQARRQRLREAGISAQDVERMHGPIGLDLGGRSPAETALAILAEVVAARYAATGMPLNERAAALAQLATG